MPAVNPHDLDDLLEDREPRREMRRAKKKLADNSNEKRPPQLRPPAKE